MIALSAHAVPDRRLRSGALSATVVRQLMRNRVRRNLGSRIVRGRTSCQADGGMLARSANAEAVTHRAAELARCRSPSGTRYLASSADSCWGRHGPGPATG